MHILFYDPGNRVRPGGAPAYARLAYFSSGLFSLLWLSPRLFLDFLLGGPFLGTQET